MTIPKISLNCILKQKNLMFRTQRKNNDFDIDILNKLSEDLINAITNSELAYHRRKFNDPNSWVHPLLSITYDIYKSFDANPSLELRGIFVDMSKAFDRVWYDGLFF